MRALRGWLSTTYGHEIPRILGDYRWCFAVVSLLFAAGAVGGALRLGGEPAGEPSASPIFHHSATPQVALLAWHNGRVALTGLAEGAISAGVLAAWAAWRNGRAVGLVVAGCAPLAREASGAGLAGTACGILAPHGLLEFPALLLTFGLALRAGAIWVWPLPGLRRWASAKRVFHDLAVALVCATLPCLVLAALAETYLNPPIADRYLLGIGRSSGLSEERRLGAAYSVSQTTWSPDGTQISALSLMGGGIWLRRADGRGPARVLAVADRGRTFRSLSWSPDGERIAVTYASGERMDQGGVLLVEATTGTALQLAGAPIGRYLGVCWSPDGPSLWVAVSRKFAGTALWSCDVRGHRWRRRLTLPPGHGAALTGGLSWLPRRHVLALTVHLGNPARETARGGPLPSRDAIWVVDNGESAPHQIATGEGITSVSWSPDGRWIGFAESRLGPRAHAGQRDATDAGQVVGSIAIVRPDGTARVDGLGRADLASSLSWSPDGRYLLYQRLRTCIIGRPLVPSN